MNSGSDPQRPWEISSRRCGEARLGSAWEAATRLRPQTTRRPGLLARPGRFISQGRALRGHDGNKRSHPAIRDLLQARALAARKLRMLGLDLEAARHRTLRA